MRRRASALISIRRGREKLEYATERDSQPPQSRGGLWHPQNAAIQLQAASQKAGNARLRSYTLRRSDVMTSLNIARDSCSS